MRWYCNSLSVSNVVHSWFMSLNSSLCKVTANGLHNLCSTTGRSKTSSVCHSVQISSVAHPGSYLKVPVVKQFEAEADHWHSSSAEVKNVRNFTSTHGTLLRYRAGKSANSPALQTYAKELQGVVEALALSPDLVVLYSNQHLILEYGCWLPQHKHGFLKLKKKKLTLVQFITSVRRGYWNTLLLFMVMACQSPIMPKLEHHPLSAVWTLIQHICSYLPYLEANFPIQNHRTQWTILTMYPLNQEKLKLPTKFSV